MKKHTELTRQDLRIYASQRLTDTPDGGGQMTNQVLTGADNELFPPISDVDRTMGAFDSRLIYPAVLRPDAAGLLGGHVIISRPPQADNVSMLLVRADFYGQERASIMERVESYRAPTVEGRMTLLGTQRKGSKIIQVYQHINAPLPTVGQSYALRIMLNNQVVYEFIRVERFEHEIRTFEDDKGEFQRRVIKMLTANALERDFVGMEDASRFKGSPPARVLETQIADSAQYFGIKPIKTALQQGSGSLKVSSIYEQLVPVSTVETAMVDDWSAGRAMWIETAPRRIVHSGWKYWTSGSLYLETPVLPTSVELDGWKDDGSGQLKNGERVLNIDYAKGVITGFDGIHISQISAIPAVQIRNHAYSVALTVDDTNIGTEWTARLQPAPTRGSVGVSFMAQGEWYELSDRGDFVLRDAEGEARGHIERTGSMVISLPVQPDVDSKIIITWTPREFYKTITGDEAGKAIAPQPISPSLTLPETPKPNLKPKTIKLAWDGGSASDDGAGNLVGGCTGTVNYATGVIYPNNLQAAQITLTAQQYIATPNTRPVSVQIGAKDVSLLVDSVQKGTLKIAVILEQQTATGYSTNFSNRLVSTL